MVVYEITASTETSCPLEIVKIPVAIDDEAFNGNGTVTGIPFTRGKYDKTTGKGFDCPREQDIVILLRIPLIYCYKSLVSVLGDSRVNENPGLLSIGIMLFRWHNVIAKRMKEEYPAWNDEELFSSCLEAWKIIYYDFLPVLINEDVEPYKQYMPHVPPGISHSFAAAASRYVHTIIPPAMILRKNAEACKFRKKVGDFPAARLCQNWVEFARYRRGIFDGRVHTWNDLSSGRSLRMSSLLKTYEEGFQIFPTGPCISRRLDAVASTIMRGRDGGLSSYNTLRKRFNLPEKEWHTINPKLYQTNRVLFDSLSNLYGGDIGGLDAFVGGMLEVDGEPGELFKAILKEQFDRLRSSDRFWFENRLNGIFTSEEIERIHNITLKDIIRETIGISDQWLQNNVFVFGGDDPCPQPFQVNITGDLHRTFRPV
ncbi:heme peroxidase, partial [Ostertagia ostertagi]